MRDDSVLARIALKLARSPEDVATESLAYILNASPSAVSGLTQLASQWVPAAGRPVVSVRSQAGEDGGARPDLELSDASGTPVILFENKFWAGLTDNQPSTYLERLRETGGFPVVRCACGAAAVPVAHAGRTHNINRAWVQRGACCKCGQGRGSRTKRRSWTHQLDLPAGLCGLGT